MEPSVEATPPPPLLHRRSHLPSRTYRSLVRICSDFHGESRVPLDTPTVLRELLLRSDNNADKEAAQVSRKETCELGENLHPDYAQPENSGMLQSKVLEDEIAAPKCSTDGGPGELTIAYDDIESAVTEKVDTTYQENDLMLGDIFDATDLQDGEVGQHHMLMDELELILNGNEHLVPENCVNLLETSLGVNHSRNDRAASVEENAKQQSIPVENVVENPSIASELKGDQKECSQKNSESINLSLEKGAAQEFSKSAEDGRSSGDPENHEERELTEMQQGKSISSTHGVVTSVTQMLGDEDIEEGEIFGDVDIVFDDLLLGDDVPVERMNEKQVSERETASNHISHTDKESSRSSPFHTAVSPPELFEGRKGRESENKLSSEVAHLGNQLLLHVTGKKVSERETASSHINHTNKESSRSSPLSAAIYRPEFVKAKMGRGSENKLGPEAAHLDKQVIQQAKEQEKAENSARESHETLFGEKLEGGSRGKQRSAPSEKTKAKKKDKRRKKRAEQNRLLGVKRLKLKPIIKLKPVKYCKHYVKGRCHKGEDCTFSHDTVPLTKSSPCSYFAAQQCMKGDDCPFDHDLAKYPCTNFTTKGSCNRGDKCLFSHKGSSQSALDASKGKPNNVAAASFSFGVLPQKTNKQTMTQTLKPPLMLPTSVHGPLAFAERSSQPNQGSSSTKSNEHGKPEIPIRKPSVVPKGISLLSFNETSLKDGLKLLSPNGNSKSSLHEQASDSIVENLLKVGHEKTATQSTPSPNRNSNEMLKRIQEISFLSLRGEKPKRMMTHVKASDQPQIPGTVQESSEQTASGHHNAKPNSQSQKTLISALKLAAEFESERVKKPTSDTGAVSKCDPGRKNATGSSSNSSKILEFLSSFSGKQSCK